MSYDNLLYFLIVIPALSSWIQQFLLILFNEVSDGEQARGVHSQIQPSLKICLLESS